MRALTVPGPHIFTLMKGEDPEPLTPKVELWTLDTKSSTLNPET
jgi:hypothetical protein